MNKVAKMLRSGREKMKWDLQEAARNTGISAATIAKLENGELTDASLATLILLKHAYGIKTDDFAVLLKTPKNAG